MRSLFVLFFFLPVFLFGQSEFSKLTDYSGVQDIAVSNEAYWVMTGKALFQYDKQTGAVCGIFNKSNMDFVESGDDFRFRGMETDRKGTLYISTSGGSFKYVDNWWEPAAGSHRFVFDENDEAGEAHWEPTYYTSCGNTVNSGYLHPVIAPDGFSYSFYYEGYICGGGGADGCVCVPTYDGLHKYTSDGWEVLFPHFTEGVPANHAIVVDTSSNFWKIEDNILSTYIYEGIPELTPRDTIDFPEELTLHSIGANNEFRLIADSGYYTYDGENMTLVAPPPPGSTSKFVWNATGDIFFTGFRDSPYALIDGAWVIMEKPYGFPYRGAEVVNRLGEKIWLKRFQSFALIDGTDHYYFHAENSPVINRTPSLIYGERTDEIWILYRQDSLLLKHDGADWTVLENADTGIDISEIEAIETDDTGRAWFSFFDNAAYGSYSAAEGWINYPDETEFAAAVYGTEQRLVIQDSTALHITGTDTIFHNYFPGFGSSNYNVLWNKTTEDGHAWQCWRNGGSSVDYYVIFFFDGEEWTGNISEDAIYGGKVTTPVNVGDTLYFLRKGAHSNSSSVLYTIYHGAEQVVYDGVIDLASPTSENDNISYFTAAYIHNEETDEPVFYLTVNWQNWGTLDPSIANSYTGKFVNDSVVTLATVDYLGPEGYQYPKTNTPKPTPTA